MAERKFFDFWKPVPIIGWGYGAVRGTVYKLAGNAAEAKHSEEMDIADLNPVRLVRHITNSIQGASKSLNEGIWIG